MKNTIYVLLLFIFSITSCDIIGIPNNCENLQPMKLTENDKRWLTDSVQYFMKENDTFRMRSSIGEPREITSSIIDCQIPIQYFIPLQTNEITSKSLGVRIDLLKTPKETNISYTFSKNTPDNLVVGVNQTMGLIDLDDNTPALPNVYFVHGEYLGTHTIRGREYTEVYKFEDLSESNIPEIDVFSITVSPIGFLRVEFYSDEVWERIIVD
ncbi:MAG: hypothetical protein COZ18_06515 [Flexibacter sp. CG_4_10_14_3_um_filter_32_15]|nr:MAG: hypothetical protein COZ18_06515 [Flexibacter sp. CG_4_10_14_3_um_filter_32_15]